MVLIDPILPGPARNAARPETAFPAARPVPHAALARLSELRGQARQDICLLQFLARAPQACLILLAAGTAVWAWTRLSAGRTTLESEFIWVLLVLIGIAAITGLHIHSYARGGAPMPLDEAAAKLRRLLFYTGMAWGSGAFLMLPALPAPLLAIGFAAGPSLALTLLLGDQKGATAFNAPVTLATASAACLGGPWLALAILAAGLLIFCLPMLQREMSARRDVLTVPTAV
ncbi:MAG: hypothetical protein ABI608_03745 [Rhizomicrobium sp.]